jgi:hypothetical protein
MKTYSAWAVCLALLTLPVMAAPRGPQTISFPDARKSVDRIVIPADSPVQFAAVIKNKDRGGEDRASFTGRFLLVGTYYYGDSDLNDSTGAAYQFAPQAYIVPDDGMAARLPQFSVRNGVRPIFISNPEAFAKAAVPEAAQRQVACRACGAASAHIAIWVDQFSAQIECDAPDYEVRFVSVYKSVRAALMPRPERGC